MADARLCLPPPGGILSPTGPTLLVASTGGHLIELLALRDRLRPRADDVVWVTFDGPQARSLLDGERVEYVPYLAPRDLVALGRDSVIAWRVLRRISPSSVVSTGSGIALAFLPLAAGRRIPAHYIESAARMAGPSLTGRLLGPLPRVRCYAQDERWSSPRWRYRGSLLDGFAGSARAGDAPMLRRVVVTLGTIAPFGFARLVRRLIQILPPDAEVLWQTGSTPTDGCGIDAHALVPPDELDDAMARADVVVAHAGLGTAMSAFRAGACPVLIPRERAFDEHVDDHQVAMAFELQRRGLCVARRVEELDISDVQAAAGRQVVRVTDPPPFLLDA